METQNSKEGRVTAAENGGGGGGGGGAQEVVVEKKKRIRKAGFCELVLRVLALVLTLAAAIVLGVDKQTKVVPVAILPTLPPLNVPLTANWVHLSAFVYFVVANAIACVYAAISLVVMVATRRRSGGKKSSAMVMTTLDLVVVALLFSGNGAAAAIGLIGYQGNSHVRWNKVCNMFGRFCLQGAAALVLSLLGSVAFLFLAVFATANLHKRA